MDANPPWAAAVAAVQAPELAMTHVPRFYRSLRCRFIVAARDVGDNALAANPMWLMHDNLCLWSYDNERSYRPRTIPVSRSFRRARLVQKSCCASRSCG